MSFSRKFRKNINRYYDSPEGREAKRAYLKKYTDFDLIEGWFGIVWYHKQKVKWEAAFDVRDRNAPSVLIQFEDERQMTVSGPPYYHAHDLPKTWMFCV